MVLEFNSDIMEKEMKIVAMEKEEITSSLVAGGAAPSLPSADLVLKCRDGAACDIGLK
jgi:hypothetical protein